jgi:hypothetical protein
MRRSSRIAAKYAPKSSFLSVAPLLNDPSRESKRHTEVIASPSVENVQMLARVAPTCSTTS